MGLELLFLLLPIAALSGWWIGKRGGKRRKRVDCNDLSSDYFKGLNYLLNEQPDQAIEVFVQMLEADDEVVEVHFALGNLFRKKGEVDRAIRIHQNLIARPTLSRNQRNQALYELGNDYMRAGLYDRAENIFHELLGSEYNTYALQQLLSIYEQEKEWEKAAVTARQMGRNVGDLTQRNIAHYLCEEADNALQRSEYELARKLVRKALSEDRNSVRASLIEARIDSARGNYKAAIKPLKRAAQQDPGLLTEVLPIMREAYIQLGKHDEFRRYLAELFNNNKTQLLITLAHTEMLEELMEGDELLSQVDTTLVQRPTLSLIAGALRFRAKERPETSRSELALLREAVEQVVHRRPGYQCANCGFSVHAMHWHCPSCKKWNTIRPVDLPG